jgi:hypothetical protein
MKHFTPLILLMLSALRLPGVDPCVAAARWERAPQNGTLTIYTHFAHPASSNTLGHMKTELDAIMLPFNLRLDWRSLESAGGHDIVAEVVVINFQGACQAEGLLTGGASMGPLGSTHIVDGEVLPYADVNCDRIRELMQPNLAVSHPAERESLLGRAMARVLAHELYHVLVHTTRHASHGIAKATYTRAELAAERLLFDEPQLRAAIRVPCAKCLQRSW